VTTAPDNAPARPAPRTESAALIAAYLVACAAILVNILALNGGKFTYTLDDPYIHLAMAESIASGHYGVNPTEPSSPASSILWPLLLAPLALTALAEWTPLAINLLCGCLAVFVIHRRLARALPGTDPAPVAVRLAGTLLVVLTCQLVTLTFSGMEHPLQVLAALLVADGILGLARGEPASRGFLLALALGPLIRYENLSFTAAGCLMLLLSRQLKPALVTGSIAVGGLLAFSGFLLLLGLEPLPSSVLVKSATEVGATPTLVERALDGLGDAWWHLRGRELLVLGSILAAITLGAALRGRWRPAPLCLALPVLAHALVGKLGGTGFHDRYLAYLFAPVLLAALASLFGAIHPRFGWRTLATTAAVVFTFAAVELAWHTTALVGRVPLAANNIHQQQYQLHRFVTDFHQGRVAVNDLGWVSYRNPRHVLDLWGLASFEAFEARAPWRGPDWMERLAAEHEVPVAMIYTQWFPEVPDSWTLVGRLRFSRPCLAPSYPDVAFFATAHGDPEALARDLARFEPTLPEGVAFEPATPGTEPN